MRFYENQPRGEWEDTPIWLQRWFGKPARRRQVHEYIQAGGGFAGWEYLTPDIDDAIVKVTVGGESWQVRLSGAGGRAMLAQAVNFAAAEAEAA